MKAIVWVRLKPDIPDTTGQAVRSSLDSLGFNEVTDVRCGKIIELEFDTGDQTSAQARVEKMCDVLLVNSSVEDYKIVSIE